MSKEVILSVEVVNGETIGKISTGKETMKGLTEKIAELEKELDNILVNFSGSSYIYGSEEKIILEDLIEMEIGEKYAACLYGHYEGFVKDGVTYWID